MFLHHPAAVFVAGEPTAEPHYRIVASVPQGQFDDERRQAIVRSPKPCSTPRTAPTGRNPRRVWVFAYEVPDGTWGGGGRIVTLADIVRLRPTLWRHGPQAALQLADQVAAAGRPVGGWWSGLAQLSLAEVHLAAGDVDRCLTELAGEPTSFYWWALRAMASTHATAWTRHTARLARRCGTPNDRASPTNWGRHTTRGPCCSTPWATSTPPPNTPARPWAGSPRQAHPIEEGTARALLAVLHARAGRREATHAEFGRASQRSPHGSGRSSTW